ncbi:C2H2 type zinc-finger [Pyrrhoderma noxium]|uniref:C2H2 type zinc-finger n=1 Tax=Pyrrhoderma noxium TaxID=2282107 RepID=A0A286UGR8_9AGAM|nr:C2H2 type zinc-finger [Pyrrhoderma noxium]
MSDSPMGDQSLFTCLSCSIAFTTGEEQRQHYRSDHHRYNMKRRVANLPPVSATVFNQKVLERRQETAVMTSPKGSTCEICHKIYTTENAYRSHLNSKKHKENESKATQKTLQQQKEQEAIEVDSTAETSQPEEVVVSKVDSQLKQSVSSPAATAAPTLSIKPDATEEEINATIDQKIAYARSRLTPSHCLFCPILSPSLTDNLTHMTLAHSFFIPDLDYLADLTGLITYLGEKIAVGNVCIYCSTRSREFRSMEAVRKHMVDKGHCKIAYGTMKDRLEVAEFYNFEKSYPDYEERKRRREERRAEKKRRKEAEKGDMDVDEEGGVNGKVDNDNDNEEGGEGDEWEDTDDEDAEIDEVVDAVPSSDSETDSDSDSELDEEDYAPSSQITYGDSPYELVLPSGARIGHRSLKRYYDQHFSLASLNRNSDADGDEDPRKSGAALVRKLLADKTSMLVPRKGGFGAFGEGTDVVKARNRGEAKEAGRHTKENIIGILYCSDSRYL